jgi:ribonuclease P protein subunit RPR2
MVQDIQVNGKNMSNKQKTSKRPSNKFRLRKDAFQEIAQKRVDILFLQAERIFSEDSRLADRYVTLARKLALKYKISFSKEQKVKFCKNCSSFLVNGNNARIRLSKGNIVIKCLNCNTIRRSKYK